MLVRECVGGLVFYQDKVFILKNGKGEWVLPKESTRKGEITYEIALKWLQEETGVLAEMLSSHGRTSYEFFSVSRQKPVCNKITWYIMKALTENHAVRCEAQFTEGGFFEIHEAMNLLTYSQEKSLVYLSFKGLKEQVS